MAGRFAAGEVAGAVGLLGLRPRPAGRRCRGVLGASRRRRTFRFAPYRKASLSAGPLRGLNNMAGAVGIEPTTYGVRVRRSAN